MLLVGVCRVVHGAGILDFIPSSATDLLSDLGQCVLPLQLLMQPWAAKVLSLSPPPMSRAWDDGGLICCFQGPPNK